MPCRKSRLLRRDPNATASNESGAVQDPNYTRCSEKGNRTMSLDCSLSTGYLRHDVG